MDGKALIPAILTAITQGDWALKDDSAPSSFELLLGQTILNANEARTKKNNSLQKTRLIAHGRFRRVR